MLPTFYQVSVAKSHISFHSHLVLAGVISLDSIIATKEMTSGENTPKKNNPAPSAPAKTAKSPHPGANPNASLTDKILFYLSSPGRQLMDAIRKSLDSTRAKYGSGLLEFTKTIFFIGFIFQLGKYSVQFFQSREFDVAGTGWLFALALIGALGLDTVYELMNSFINLAFDFLFGTESSSGVIFSTVQALVLNFKAGYDIQPAGIVQLWNNFVLLTYVILVGLATILAVIVVSVLLFLEIIEISFLAMFSPVMVGTIVFTDQAPFRGFLREVIMHGIKGLLIVTMLSLLSTAAVNIQKAEIGRADESVQVIKKQEKAPDLSDLPVVLNTQEGTVEEKQASDSTDIQKQEDGTTKVTSVKDVDEIKEESNRSQGGFAQNVLLRLTLIGIFISFLFLVEKFAREFFPSASAGSSGRIVRQSTNALIYASISAVKSTGDAFGRWSRSAEAKFGSFSRSGRSSEINDLLRGSSRFERFKYYTFSKYKATRDAFGSAFSSVRRGFSSFSYFSSGASFFKAREGQPVMSQMKDLASTAWNRVSQRFRRNRQDSDDQNEKG